MRAIKDFNGYFITEDGRIWSQKNKKWLKPYKGTDGYFYVSLCKNGVRNKRAVHRLVAETFIPKTEKDIRLNRNCVDHIDGCRTNNHKSNLRWCTYKENNNFPLAKENQKKAKEHKMKPVIIDNIEYESATKASEILGINRVTIVSRLKSPNFPNY